MYNSMNMSLIPSQSFLVLYCSKKSFSSSISNSRVQSPTTKRGRAKILRQWNTIQIMKAGTSAFLVDKKHNTQNSEYSDAQTKRNNDLNDLTTTIPYAESYVG